MDRMREARIKIDPKSAEAVYHCVSKAVAAAYLFDGPAKETFRKQLWRAADYCGVQVITYVILDNHFHVTVRVPKAVPVSDTELLRRYCLYCDLSDQDDRARLATIKCLLKTNDSKADQWRKSQLAQMGDVSAFMKKWKQRFSHWFNAVHHRIGTLWASRFCSLLVEPTGFALEAVSAYVDLNSVRAGIVTDPKDYRFCGYAEAVTGNVVARRGLMRIYQTLPWKHTQERYRQALFGIGASARKGKAAIPYADYQRVTREKGEMPFSEVYLARIRYFVHGGVLGSQAFVQEQLAGYENRTRKRPRTRPRPLPGPNDWHGLHMMRNVRRDAA
ncbi:MAG TPA: transposase [Candidatus Didemnitutus sp.]|nr:transposase [Candidatus Didemnitutus sp.]